MQGVSFALFNGGVGCDQVMQEETLPSDGVDGVVHGVGRNRVQCQLMSAMRMDCFHPQACNIPCLFEFLTCIDCVVVIVYI